MIICKQAAKGSGYMIQVEGTDDIVTEEVLHIIRSIYDNAGNRRAAARFRKIVTLAITGATTDGSTIWDAPAESTAINLGGLRYAD